MSGGAAASARLRRLQQLERIADLHAQTARRRLAEAQGAEAAIRQSLGRLEARRAGVLHGDPASDPAMARATAAWLRWTEQERRRLLTNQAARRAESLEVRDAAARVIARHLACRRLWERESARIAAARRD